MTEDEEVQASMTEHMRLFERQLQIGELEARYERCRELARDFQIVVRRPLIPDPNEPMCLLWTGWRGPLRYGSWVPIDPDDIDDCKRMLTASLVQAHMTFFKLSQEEEDT